MHRESEKQKDHFGDMVRRHRELSKDGWILKAANIAYGIHKSFGKGNFVAIGILSTGFVSVCGGFDPAFVKDVINIIGDKIVVLFGRIPVPVRPAN